MKSQSFISNSSKRVMVVVLTALGFAACDPTPKVKAPEIKIPPIEVRFDEDPTVGDYKFTDQQIAALQSVGCFVTSEKKLFCQSIYPNLVGVDELPDKLKLEKLNEMTEQSDRREKVLDDLRTQVADQVVKRALELQATGKLNELAQALVLVTKQVEEISYQNITAFQCTSDDRQDARDLVAPTKVTLVTHAVSENRGRSASFVRLGNPDVRSINLLRYVRADKSKLNSNALEFTSALVWQDDPNQKDKYLNYPGLRVRSTHEFQLNSDLKHEVFPELAGLRCLKERNWDLEKGGQFTDRVRKNRSLQCQLRTISGVSVTAKAPLGNLSFAKSRFSPAINLPEVLVGTENASPVSEYKVFSDTDSPVVISSVAREGWIQLTITDAKSGINLIELKTANQVEKLEIDLNRWNGQGLALTCTTLESPIKF